MGGGGGATFFFGGGVWFYMILKGMSLDEFKRDPYDPYDFKRDELV